MTFIIIFAILAVVLAVNVRVVPQTEARIIERLGTYYTTWSTGINFKIPLLDHVGPVISLKEQVVEFPPQPVITKDNITMEIDTIIYFAIVNPKLYAYGVSSPMSAIANLTATTLRNIIGALELDATLTSRGTVNAQMQVVLDEATEPWGIKINRVELKNIIPPPDIRDAMEKQMRAEREKRSQILTAEGTRAAAILAAEGAKQAAILNAEGAKQQQILSAEADKEAKIRRAEGEAQAITTVADATSAAYRILNSEVPKPEILQVKGMEALIEASKGGANKLIIPTDLTGVVSTLTTLASVVKDKQV